MQNPKIPVCIFRRFHFAKSEDCSLHFPNFDSARCRQANARNILDQLHAQKTPVGTRRKSGVAKTGGLVPSEGIFSLVLAKPQVWFLPSLFSAHNWQDRRFGTPIRKFGTRCSEKPQVRKFASRYSGYQTSCFARRWVPNRQSWRAWVPNPLILSAIFRHEIPNPAVLSHIMRRQVPNSGILPCGRRVTFLRLGLRCIPWLTNGHTRFTWGFPNF